MDASDEAPENYEIDTEKTFEPDPSVVAFLDQESAAFAEIADEFEGIYGFRHDCHCDEDYTTGKVGEVTECFAGMIVEALATCARLNYEKQELEKMVTTLMGMTRQLLPEQGDGTDPVSDDLIYAVGGISEEEADRANGIEFLDNPTTGDDAR